LSEIIGGQTREKRAEVSIRVATRMGGGGTTLFIIEEKRQIKADRRLGMIIVVRGKRESRRPANINRRKEESPRSKKIPIEKARGDL